MIKDSYFGSYENIYHDSIFQTEGLISYQFLIRGNQKIKMMARVKWIIKIIIMLLRYYIS